jgi:hypothetical protein
MLGFLAIAFLGAFRSSVQGRYNAVTALSVLVGLAGATMCTIAGLRALYVVPPDQRTLGKPR